MYPVGVVIDHIYVHADGQKAVITEPLQRESPYAMHFYLSLLIVKHNLGIYGVKRRHRERKGQPQCCIVRLFVVKKTLGLVGGTYLFY